MNRDAIIKATETALASVLKEKVQAGRDPHCIIGRETGDIKVVANFYVVERVTNKQHELSLTAARKVKPDAQVGEVIEVDVTPKDLVSITGKVAKDAIVQALRSAERDGE